MGDSDLIWAIKTGDMEEVEAKVVTADDANRTLDGGRKPLHYAADFGQEAVIKFLVSKGADVDAADKHGITPLISAIYEGHVACVKVLLELGASKDCKGPDGVCALESADCSAIKELLE